MKINRVNKSAKACFRAAQAVLILGLLIFTSSGLFAETRIQMETTPTSHTTEIRIRSTIDDRAMLIGTWHIVATSSDRSGVLFDCSVSASTKMTCATPPPPKRT